MAQTPTAVSTTAVTATAAANSARARRTGPRWPRTARQPSSTASTPGITEDRAFYILPPGNYGGLPTNDDSLDQLPLYDGLTPLRGDVTDDDQLNDMGDVALGVVNSHHYSAAHPSATNKKFVQAFEAANKFRPNFMAVAGYDGMHVIYNALAATKGQGGGDALLAAMKGQIFESPRGPILIDAQTRDIVQDIYIRKVERVPSMGNQLYNVEFDVQKAVKDPGKAK